MCDDVDINALTIEQYLALIQDNNRPGIVKPTIGDDVKFEINSNIMRELRRKLFVGTDDEDAHEHVRGVLEIVDLFYFPGVTHDAVMLRVFPITLKGRALRWKKGLPVGMINTWDLLEKEFIRQYCSPFKIAKKLKEIRNFKQEMCETLYQAWERYNDLLFKCPQHDLNNHQKVQIFYTGLDISTYHSHNWYDETTPRKKINDSPNNVDTIQASFKGANLTKEYPLEKEDKTVEQREKFKARTTMGKENIKGLVPQDLPPTPFLGHLKEQIVSLYSTRETVSMIENPGEVRKLKAREDEGDIDVDWDITIEDVERL
ncbi:ribonuclease H-like domain-containing protein, partial [Tanacetum coccineum]